MIQNEIGQTPKGNIHWWLLALGLWNLQQTRTVEICSVLLLFLFIFSLSLNSQLSASKPDLEIVL